MSTPIMPRAAFVSLTETEVLAALRDLWVSFTLAHFDDHRVEGRRSTFRHRKETLIGVLSAPDDLMI